MPLAHELTYEFEEMPLVTRMNFRAALISGTAHISYEDSGFGNGQEWQVDEFEFEGSLFNPKSRRFDEKSITVSAESDPALFAILEKAFEDDCGEHVLDKIYELEAA
jgi:hypothetical protein